MAPSHRLILGGMAIGGLATLALAGSAAAPAKAGPAPATRPAAARAAGPAFIPAPRPSTRPTASAPAPPDLSTPQSAARAYAQVVLLGQYPKALRSVTLGDEAAYQQVEAAANQANAQYELAAAMAERFGDAGREAAPGRDADYAKFIELVGKARALMESDSCHLIAPGTDFALSLRRTNNQWRVELPRAMTSKDERRMTVDWMNAAAQTLRDHAADVRAGKFAGVQEAEQGRINRLKQLREKLKPQTVRLPDGR